MPKDCQRAMPSWVWSQAHQPICRSCPGSVPRLTSSELRTRPAWSRPPCVWGKETGWILPAELPAGLGLRLDCSSLYIPLGESEELSPMDCFYSSQERTWHPGKCFLAEKSLRIKNLILPDSGIESSHFPFQTIEAIGLLPTVLGIYGDLQGRWPHRSQSFENHKILRLCKEEMMTISSVRFFSIQPKSYCVLAMST